MPMCLLYKLIYQGFSPIWFLSGVKIEKALSALTFFCRIQWKCCRGNLNDITAQHSQVDGEQKKRERKAEEKVRLWLSVIDFSYRPHHSPGHGHYKCLDTVMSAQTHSGMFVCDCVCVCVGVGPTKNNTQGSHPHNIVSLQRDAVTPAKKDLHTNYSFSSRLKVKNSKDFTFRDQFPRHIIEAQSLHG